MQNGDFSNSSIYWPEIKACALLKSETQFKTNCTLYIFPQKASFKTKEGKSWLDEWFCYLCYASRINSILSHLYYLAYTAQYNIFLLYNNILCIYRTEILYVMTELFYPVQKMTCINGKISKKQKEKIFYYYRQGSLS